MVLSQHTRAGVSYELLDFGMFSLIGSCTMSQSPRFYDGSQGEETIVNNSNRAHLSYVAGLAVLLAQGELRGETKSSPDLSQQIFEIMSHAPGLQPGHRPLHAKGVVCLGAF